MMQQHWGEEQTCSALQGVGLWQLPAWLPAAATLLPASKIDDLREEGELNMKLRMQGCRRRCPANVSCSVAPSTAVWVIQGLHEYVAFA